MSTSQSRLIEASLAQTEDYVCHCRVSHGTTSHAGNEIRGKTERLCEVFIVIAVTPPVLLTIALLALAI